MFVLLLEFCSEVFLTLLLSFLFAPLFFGLGNSITFGGIDKGPLFSIKNSSVVAIFSFLKTFPASEKPEQEEINVNNMKDYANIDRALDHLKFQSDAIKITRERISNSKSLIGFVGGPWTLVRYAFGKDKFIIDSKVYFEFLNTTLVPLLKKNIKLQLDAGAEIVMIFDSSLYDLNAQDFEQDYLPLLDDISSSFPKKVGYYSRGKQEKEILPLMKFPFAGFGFDKSINLKNIFENLTHGFVQGNFDEKLMLLNSDNFKNELINYIETMKSIENKDGWVCGLGHGINKETPEKNVHLFIENIRKAFS